MPDANGYPYPWEPGYQLGQGTAQGQPAAPAAPPRPTSFPIQVPDPANPQGTRWVDSATGAPVPAPGTGPNANNIATGAPQSTQPPAAQTGQPATGQPPTTTPQSTAQGAAAAGGQGAPAVGAGAGAQGMYTPDQATASAASAVQQANLNVASAYQAIQDQQKLVDQATATASTDPIAGPAKLQAAQTGLNAAYAQLSQAEDSLSTANTTYATSLDKFTDPQALAQADQARQTAAEAKARTALLTDDTPGGQRALNAAQGALASAQAASAQADADAKRLTAGPQRDALEGQAAQSQAQAAQINLLIGTKDNPGPLIQKAQAEVGTQVATTDQIQAQARLNDATARRQDADGRLSDVQAQVGQAQIAAGVPAAQAAQAAGAGAASQAQAQATLQGIAQKQQGPAYGLAQQIPLVREAINQIASRVWGPGGSGDQADADQFLAQYVQATLGGTTISDAAKQAAAQQGINYGTTMAGTNALQQAQAQRANAFASFGGNALGTLEQMNMYAPKGSTGMADAFSGVMNAMANRIAPQGFGPVSIPQAPALPPFLQAFAAGHQAGTAQANAQNQGAGGGQAAPTVNINVNGGQGTSAAPVSAPVAGAPPPPPTTPLGAFNPQASTAAMNTLGFQDTPQGRAQMAQVFGGQGTPGQGTPGQQAPTGPQQTPQQAFDQGLANAPQMPNYLQGLVNPMSMITSARNAGLLGSNTGGLLTPGLPGSFVQ